MWRLGCFLESRETESEAGSNSLCWQRTQFHLSSGCCPKESIYVPSTFPLARSKGWVTTGREPGEWDATESELLRTIEVKHFLFVGPLPTALGTALLRPHPHKQQQNCEKEEAGGSWMVLSVVSTVACLSQGQSLCILSLWAWEAVLLALDFSCMKAAFLLFLTVPVEYKRPHGFQWPQSNLFSTYYVVLRKGLLPCLDEEHVEMWARWKNSSPATFFSLGLW